MWRKTVFLLVGIGIVLGDVAEDLPGHKEPVNVKPWLHNLQRIQVDRINRIHSGTETDPIPDEDQDEIIKPYLEEIKRIQEIIDKIKEGHRPEEQSVIKPWYGEVKRIQENINRIKEGREIDPEDGGPTVIKPWYGEIKRIRDLIRKIEEENRPEDIEQFKGVIKPWMKEMEKVRETIRRRKEEARGSETEEEGPEVVKPWLPEIKRIRDIIRKIEAGEQKPGMDKKQKIKEHIDEQRMKHRPDGTDEEDEIKNVKPWLVKLERIQQRIRENRQRGGQENLDEGTPKIGDGIGYDPQETEPVPENECDENEFLHPCGNHCEDRCDFPYMCRKYCGRPACACKEGFARTGEGKCVPKERCTPWQKEVEKFQENMKKIKERKGVEKPVEEEPEETQPAPEDVKLWLKKLQKIQDYLRGLREKEGQVIQEDTPIEMDEQPQRQKRTIPDDILKKRPKHPMLRPPFVHRIPPVGIDDYDKTLKKQRKSRPPMKESEDDVQLIRKNPGFPRPPLRNTKIPPFHATPRPRIYAGRLPQHPMPFDTKGQGHRPRHPYLDRRPPGGH